MGSLYTRKINIRQKLFFNLFQLRRQKQMMKAVWYAVYICRSPANFYKCFCVKYEQENWDIFFGRDTYRQYHTIVFIRSGNIDCTWILNKHGFGRENIVFFPNFRCL